MKFAIARLCLVLAPGVLDAQSGSIVGSLVARESGVPLSYGIVGVEGQDRTTFTSDSGGFSFRNLRPGQHLLHVRRLGFTPRDVSFVVRDGMTDTLRVELTRVALRLTSVDVKAYPPCIRPGAPTNEQDSTLATIIGQIRLNAEQYKFLEDLYPHSYYATVNHSKKNRRDGTVTPDRSFTRRFDSSRRSRYRPGGVLVQTMGGIDFHVPTLVEVADPAFVNAHCWHYGGIDHLGDEPLVRVDVVAFDGLRGADVNGSFLLNSNTFQIRRSIVHLSRGAIQLPGMLDFTATTEFHEVLPSIPVAWHVYAVRKYDQSTPRISEAYEEQRTTRFTWKGRKPGDGKQPE